MKYKKQILEAFARIGFTPRGNQVADIDKVLRAFLDDGFKTVVLSAPTGTGKSIIGIVVSDVIHQLRFPDVNAGASFLCTPTIALQEQYQKSFASEDPLDTKFRLIKGAGNFECSALSTPEETQTAESCALRLFHKEGLSQMISQHCDGCMFQFQKKMRDRARHLILNYQIYFIDRMYMEVLAKRTVCVFDEAHMINDLFTEHNAIYFSDSRLKKMIEEINEAMSLPSPEVFKILREVSTALLNGEINDTNYMGTLATLADAYGQVTEAAQAAAERAIHDHKKYLKLSRLSKKYFGLGCKIGDLMSYGYPHAFEFKERNPKFNQHENEISVKPIFVGDMFDKLINAEFNLLMSATLSEQYARRTLTLENAVHIRLAPSFPKENKKIVFFKPQNLNYTSLKEPKVVKQLQATCYEIVAHHVKLGERGVVLAPSFALVEGITQALEGMNVGAKIFEHRRGEKLADVLGRFTTLYWWASRVC
jgi:Rad3-related DNA helicase